MALFAAAANSRKPEIVLAAQKLEGLLRKAQGSGSANEADGATVLAALFVVAVLILGAGGAAPNYSLPDAQRREGRAVKPTCCKQTA